MDEHPERTQEQQVRRVLLLEGAANVAVGTAKVVVGLTTGSVAVLGDAVHSLADLANNGVGLVAIRLAASPPDRDHPYGHRKFETLAVFALATLLAVLALELASRAFSGPARPVEESIWGLALMLGVLLTNAGVSLWEERWARRLDSDLLRADARHTLSDVLVTLAVIASWQLAARGHHWLDPLTTLFVAALILRLAYGLFRRAIPVLVDRSFADPESLQEAVSAVGGVHATRRIRSQGVRGSSRIDVVVSVDPELSTRESHAIADEVERVLKDRFAAEDVTVHVEPDFESGGGDA